MDVLIRWLPVFAVAAVFCVLAVVQQVIVERERRLRKVKVAASVLVDTYPSVFQKSSGVSRWMTRISAAPIRLGEVQIESINQDISFYAHYPQHLTTRTVILQGYAHTRATEPDDLTLDASSLQIAPLKRSEAN